MKRKVCRALAGIGLAMAAGAAASACSGTEDCSDTGTCPGGQTSSSSGTTSGDSPSCVPAKGGPPVPDECGIWVSSSQGHDGNYGGFKYAPAKTLKEAMKRLAMPEWAGSIIYVCAEVFVGQIEVPAGTTIYGGLDCTTEHWDWIGDVRKSTLRAPPDLVAMRLAAGEGTTHIEDLEVRPADGHEPGRSSIAVLASGVTAELVRCDLIAGDATDGANGAPGAAPPAPGEPVPAATKGANGESGAPACVETVVTIGGVEVESTCGDGYVSTGGKGGNGQVASGTNGEAGTPGIPGAGGTGQPISGPWSCAPTLGRGYTGDSGAPGAPGAGALGLGALSLKWGYVGTPGAPGTPGLPGYGGGGGGGAKGPTGQGCPGASGGSGGAGGCGGLPGMGGQAGGSSIALASLDARVTLTDCTLETGKAGRGGGGGALQPGGIGGHGGTGGTGALNAPDACTGGNGGAGGDGGPGGGGLGGHSIAIAYSGTAVTKAGGVSLSVGSPGEGGPGGSADMSNGGESGVSAEEQEMVEVQP